MYKTYLNLGDEKGFYNIFCYKGSLALFNKEINSSLLIELCDDDDKCYRIPFLLDGPKNNIFYLKIQTAELFIPLYFETKIEYIDIDGKISHSKGLPPKESRDKIFDSVDKCKEYICSEFNSDAKLPKTLKFNYINWKGEFGEREVDTSTILFYYGKTEWHPEKQWLMEALDVNKNETRTFAVKDIKELLFKEN